MGPPVAPGARAPDSPAADRDATLSGTCLGAATLLLTAPARAQGITDMKKGDGTNAVQGSAGPSGTPNAASDLERCDKPMGAVAVVEPQDYVGRALAKYQLGSPVGLIRL